MSTEKSENSDMKYYCERCHYICYRKYDFSKHISTSKHKNQQKSTEKSEKSEKSENIFICLDCNKKFKDRSGLWRHNKICIQIKEK